MYRRPTTILPAKERCWSRDNEVNIEITRNILLHKNLQGGCGGQRRGGRDAFSFHEPGYYDVILMDIRMPVMDGLAATRKIRESGREDSKTVPIVAMTANVFEEDVRKSLDAGMDAHLSKPIEITQMYAVLDRYDLPLRKEKGLVLQAPAPLSNFVEGEGQGRWMLKTGTDFAEK